MARGLRSLALVGVLVVAAASGGLAEGTKSFHLNGLINDHTVPTFGSWEVHGVWSLEVDTQSNRADFNAELTMERSDLYFVDTPSADPGNPAMRNAHTHHIAVRDAEVTAIAGGFRLTGPADVTIITGNGFAAPFETKPPSSTVQIDVTGGKIVTYSNVTLTFGGPAANHFGPNAVAGVVKSWK